MSGSNNRAASITEAPPMVSAATPMAWQLPNQRLEASQRTTHFKI